MSLKKDDVIYIHGFKHEEPEFYCWKHFKDLINFPTKVFLERNGVLYVTHPTLDLVPLSDNCVNYEIIENVDIGGHQNFKQKLIDIKKMGAKKIPIKTIKKIFKEQEEKSQDKNQWIVDLINDLNNGDIDINFIENLMGGWERFFNIVNKKGLLDLIDPFSNNVSEYQNILLWNFIQVDPSFVWKIVDKYFSDVTKIGDKYYVDDDGEDLSQFFKESRDISEKTISSLISGEYDFDPFYDVTDDEYRDVYENLDNKNQENLKEKIKKELIETGKMDITSNTPDLFDELGEDGEVILTEENINLILEDDDSLRYLINQEMDEIRSDLYSLYSSCYSDVWYDEARTDIMDALVGFVIDDDVREEYQYTKQVYNKEGSRESKTFWGSRYPATNCIYETVSEFLNSFKNESGTYETLEYYGSYTGVLKHLCDYGDRDYLRSPSLPDYPSYREVEKCINYNFTSYF